MGGRQIPVVDVALPTSRDDSTGKGDRDEYAQISDAGVGGDGSARPGSLLRRHGSSTLLRLRRTRHHGDRVPLDAESRPGDRPGRARHHGDRVCLDTEGTRHHGDRVSLDTEARPAGRLTRRTKRRSAPGAALRAVFREDRVYPTGYTRLVCLPARRALDNPGFLVKDRITRRRNNRFQTKGAVKCSRKSQGFASLLSLSSQADALPCPWRARTRTIRRRRSRPSPAWRTSMSIGTRRSELPSKCPWCSTASSSEILPRKHTFCSKSPRGSMS